MYIDVPSVDEYVDRVKKLGGQVCVPKMAVPGMGYFAVCLDPENNGFGLWEDNPKRPVTLVFRLGFSKTDASMPVNMKPSKHTPVKPANGLKSKNQKRKTKTVLKWLTRYWPGNGVPKPLRK